MKLILCAIIALTLGGCAHSRTVADYRGNELHPLWHGTHPTLLEVDNNGLVLRSYYWSDNGECYKHLIDHDQAYPWTWRKR